MKNLDFVYLLDFYGGILNERQRQVMSLYYDDDLSLAEIAEIANISRQGAHDFIKRGEVKLLEADKALGLVSRFEGIKETVDLLEASVEKSDCTDKQQILSLIQTLKNQV